MKRSKIVDGRLVTVDYPKVTSEPASSSTPAIATSNLPEISGARAPRPRDENPANTPIPEPWRRKHERKGTWLGARIPHGSHLAAIAALAELRKDAELALRQEVEMARAEGTAWSMIGPMIGTTPEAARQRYGARS